MTVSRFLAVATSPGVPGGGEAGGLRNSHSAQPAAGKRERPGFMMAGERGSGKSGKRGAAF